MPLRILAREKQDLNLRKTRVNFEGEEDTGIGKTSWGLVIEFDLGSNKKRNPVDFITHFN